MGVDSPNNGTQQTMGHPADRDAEPRAAATSVPPSPATIHQVVSELTSDLAFSSRVDERAGIIPEWANDSFEEVLGYTLEELTRIGGWKAIVRPDDAHLLFESLQKLADGAESVRHEMRVITKAGDVRWLRTYARAERDSDTGVPLRVIGAAQDITERVAAEERYRTISNLTSDVTFALHIDGTSTVTTDWVAGAHTELTGYTFEETEILGWRNLIHPADRRWYEQRLTRLGENEIDGSEVRITTKSGDVRFVRIIVRRVEAPSGTMKYVGAVRDLTERRRAARLLAESEERYRAVSQMTSDVAYSYHLDGDGRPVIDWVTEGTEELTGYTSEEMEAMGGWRGILVPEHRVAYEERLDTLFAGNSVTREFQIVTKSGVRRWVEISARSEQGPGGEIVRVYGAVRDVDERKQAEDALAASEAQLREAQAVAKLGSFRRDVATGKMEWSDELFRLAGYEPGDVEPDQSWLLEHIHPDDRDAFLGRLARLVGTGEGHEQEFRFVRPDGRIVWVHSRAEPEFGSDGEVVAITGIAQDVTERHRNEQLHRVVSEMVSDILFSYRIENGRFVADWVAGAYERVSGHRLAPEFGTDLFTPIAHPDDRPLIEEAESRVLSGEPHVCAIRVITADGATRWLKLYVQPVMGDLDGDVVGAYGAAQDITANKETVAVLRRAYERERGAAAHLREADQMKDEFLTTASHELRTPLTAIVGFASALARGRTAFDDATYDDIADRLEHNALELGNMVERLLDFSCLEAGTVRLDVRAVSLEDVIRQCLDIYANEISHHEMALDVDGGVEVLADPAALSHVLGNLISNAAKYAPPASTISITVSQDDTQAVVTVADRGPGIAPEERTAVFERFFRGSEQPSGTHGSGIGLAIARSYVELMDGRIRVEETPGGGATFVFHLPLAAHDRVEVAEVAEAR